MSFAAFDPAASGFGFMDNVVMITMGDLIDSTLGVTFGLSTLTAAGFGQVDHSLYLQDLPELYLFRSSAMCLVFALEEPSRPSFFASGCRRLS